MSETDDAIERVTLHARDSELALRDALDESDRDDEVVEHAHEVEVAAADLHELAVEAAEEDLEPDS